MKTTDPLLVERFREQRSQAKQRGIEWQLHFSEWLQIWQPAAVWSNAAGGKVNFKCADPETLAPTAPRTSGLIGWKSTPAKPRKPNAVSACAKLASTEALQRVQVY